jgi:DNA-binding Xre family transcriptional regulator
MMARYRGKNVRLRRKGSLRLRLREILHRRKVTGYALAKYTGLSLNTIYRLTRPNGRFRLIQADTLERLCAALRVTPADLFDYEKPGS